jgi:polysaccharide export outer membrane protein
MRSLRSSIGVLVVALACVAAISLTAQTASPGQSIAVPADYIIGPDDVLGVVFWREPDMSGDATVRPDGKITVPVIGEIQAAGLEPSKLQQQILVSARKYLTDANVAVVVRTINSRKVFVTGQVKAPGAFPLTGQLTVLQAIALAGGLLEYADGKNVSILRNDGSATTTLKFNYKDVSKGKKLEQNIVLKPGDTVVVP